MQYETYGSACFDFESAAPEFILNPGERAKVGTGACVSDIIKTDYLDMYDEEIPCIEVCSRSGLAYKSGVIVLNAPGIVDMDYPGEICVLLINLGENPVAIKTGDRIAQGRLSCVRRAPNIRVAPTTRLGGFGSSGGVSQ
jgi:dUTP pyrophosphatase